MNWVEVDGTVYQKPCALITEMGLEHPTFAKLIDIYVVQTDKVFFQVQPLQTTEFYSHFHCYLVEEVFPKSSVSISVESLFSFLPHHIKVLPHTINTLCIVPRHHFINCTD